MGGGSNPPAADPYNGYQYVDLGLPSGLKWATCNVGATKPEEAGLYFAWGATEGAGSDVSDGKTFDKHPSAYDPQEGYPKSGDIPSTLDAEHDAAAVNMGGDWHMPDKADIDELIENTITEWTTVNGIGGMMFHSKANGNKMFVPGVGNRGYSSLESVGVVGCVWSRNLNTGNTYHAWYLYFDNGGYRRKDYNARYYGFSVRGVIS